MASRRGSRHESFDEHQPFENDRSLQFRSATGTFSFMNPTRARFEYAVDQSSALRHLATRARAKVIGAPNDSAEPQSLSTDDPNEQNETRPLLGASSQDSVSFLWRSRDNRKGRHALLVRPTSRSRASLAPRTNTLLATLQGISVMFTRFPYWDLSWLLAVTYTLGSLIWVLNGFLVTLSITGPEADVTEAAGWTAFVGGTVFFTASILMMVEVLSASPNGCFGWEVEQTGSQGMAEARPADCEHHHQGNQTNVAGEVQEEDVEHQQSSSSSTPCNSWRWWLPSWQELKEHYLYEISFVACSIQALSSVFFWVSKFLAIPPISARISDVAMVGGYYVPTVIGGLGFIIASTLLMLETQPRWYIPAPGVLGWHVCFWKLLGSIGFTISGALGPFRYDYQVAFYQSSIATLWGSWAMLIGSLLQWFESLDKHPVIEEGNGRISEWHAGSEKGYE